MLRQPNTELPLRPAGLLLEYQYLFSELPPGLPVLDLACGEGDNGIYLATKGLEVVLLDRSQEALMRAGEKARSLGVKVELRRVDLEVEGENPLGDDRYAGVLVFRYLHRPLLPHIKEAVARGGLLFYETFTEGQARFGRPRNPDFLLRPGELKAWFGDWIVVHYFEGVLDGPKRAVAGIVCRRPGAESRKLTSSKRAAVSCP